MFIWLARIFLFFSFPWFFQLPGTHPGYLPPARQEAVVLMYHHISPRPEGRFSITPELFAGHLDMLQKEGYQVIAIEQLGDFLEGRAGIPEKSVVITFDDGYESFYTYAYPELLKRKMVATNFLIVGNIDKTSADIPRLTWAQIKEMQAQGMSFYPHSFQSHYETSLYPTGRKYSCLTGRIWLAKEKRWETKAEYIKRVTRELRLAREIMERELGRPMVHFAWPYGQSTPTSLKIARSVGYRYFYYVSRGEFDSRRDCYGILRINAGNPHITPQILNRNIQKFIFLQELKQIAFGLNLFNPVMGQASLIALNKRGT